MKTAGRWVCLLLVLVLIFPAPAAQAKTKRLSSLEEVASMVEEHAARLDVSYTIPCEWSLVEELKSLSSVGQGTTLLSEILLQSGNVSTFSVGWYDHEVYLDDIHYYPGWRILKSRESGNTSSLTAREKQTLDAALELIAGASGSDLEKERFIYDALCRRIVYTGHDDGSGDKDCAIGALLSGRADCDGYSDAMMLCCALAGIPCRLIHGRALQSMQPGSGMESHLWNLVFIAGSWLICDVTWGDQQLGPCYLYFNLGRQDAALSYHWNAGTLFTEIARTADFQTQLMPDQQPAVVHTLDDVYQAARSAALAGSRSLTLYSPDEALWETGGEAFWKMFHCAAFNSFSYRDSGCWFEAANIILPEDPFCFCDTEAEFLSAVRSYADGGVSSFAVFFHPSLADQLFADGHAGLLALISQSRIAATGQYYYSTDSGSVLFKNVSFSD